MERDGAIAPLLVFFFRCHQCIHHAQQCSETEADLIRGEREGVCGSP